MPLKRTPTNTPNKEKGCDNNLSTIRKSPQAGSTPNLSSLSDENVTNRLKRKRDEDTTILDEIRSLLSLHSVKSDTKLASLEKAMAEIMVQNSEIKESIAFISQQYDDINTKVQSLESARETDRNYIQLLEQKVDNLERQMLSTSLEIRNVPMKTGEMKDDLCEIVTEAAKVLNTPVQRNDIKDVYRIKKKDGLPVIIVDFLSANTKENMIKKARQFNFRNQQQKLNTGHIKLEGPAKPIYLSERLTAKNNRLYYLARKFASGNGFKYCWTSYGKIFLRESDGKQQIPITYEADLNALRPQPK